MTTIMDHCNTQAKVDSASSEKKDSDKVGGSPTDAKQSSKSVSDKSYGLERPTTTQPIGSLLYPPGSTLLECRLEGDLPVAHVVQIAPNGNGATPNTCFFIETKQSAAGPYSRIISQPPNSDQPCNGSAEAGLSYRLESRTGNEGPAATIATVPALDSCTGRPNQITALEVTKGEGQPDGPVSRILYGPSIGEAYSSVEDACKVAATMIECSSSAKRTSAKITQRMKNGVDYETSSQKSGLKKPSCCLQDLMETRVDENGPRAYINLPRRTKSARSEPINKSYQEQPKAKTSEMFKAKCLTTCPGTKKQPPKVDRRNGLDAEDNLPTSLFKRIPREQLCSCSDQTKDERKKESSSAESGHRDQGQPPDSKMIKCILLPCNVAKKLADSAKTKESLKPQSCNTEKKKSSNHYTKPKTVPKTCHNNTGPEMKTEKDVTEEAIPKISSQELLTRFRDYFSPHKLNEYEVCRSRRNGLQDQCQLDIPRTVIELKKKEMLNGGSRQDNKGMKSSQPLIFVCTNADSNFEEMENGKECVAKKHAKKKHAKGTSESKKSLIPKKKAHVKTVKSRELHVGTIYIDCDCYHRNGLQQDCPRSTCGGRTCKVQPWPECELGTYFTNKWGNYYHRLDRVPPTSFCGSHKAWVEFIDQEEEKLKKLREEQEKAKEIKTLCLKEFDTEETNSNSDYDKKSSKSDNKPCTSRYLIVPAT